MKMEEVISKGRDKAAAGMHSRQDFKRNIFPCGTKSLPNLPAAPTIAYARQKCTVSPSSHCESQWRNLVKRKETNKTKQRLGINTDC